MHTNAHLYLYRTAQTINDIIIDLHISLMIKASIHVATATSVILLIGMIYKGYSLILLFLIPLLAWSRVKTREHTVLETIIGSLLGVALILIVYTISKQYFVNLIYN